MTYREQSEQVFVYFAPDERRKIEAWLIKHGYKIDSVTVCGNCCGYYADEYLVDGLGGSWHSTEDYEAFVSMCRQESIPIESSPDDHHIKAVEV